MSLWSNTGAGQPLTVDNFREAREKLEQRRSVNPIPPRHKQIMFVLVPGEGDLLLPPRVFDVLAKHGYNDESAPAWTPAEMEALHVDLEEAMNRYETYCSTVLKHNELQISNARQQRSASEALAELRPVFGDKVDLIPAKAEEIAKTTPMAYSEAFWSLYRELKRVLASPDVRDVEAALDDAASRLKTVSMLPAFVRSYL
jgi:hypothetical protein